MKDQKQRPIVVFNHDVTEEDLAIIPEDFYGDIVIHGDMIISRAISITGNFWIYGDIDCYDIEVIGDLICDGSIDSGETKIAGDFISKGNLNFNESDIEVAGDFLCEGDIDSDGSVIIVRGDFFCKGDITCWNTEIAGDILN